MWTAAAYFDESDDNNRAYAPASSLEIGKLKRENQALLEIIGRLTVACPNASYPGLQPDAASRTRRFAS